LIDSFIRMTWAEAAEQPVAMLRPSMHERRFID
jgi:hypothetical protein